MDDSVLFKSSIGNISKGDMLCALKDVGAHDCDILFIHTEINFGAPVGGLKRRELLASLMDILTELKVGTLIFPTFTFSFCNNEVYDIQNSKTYMGTLNEYARKICSGERSRDPLLSFYVIGEKYNLIDNIGNSSLGKGSGYDRLHNCGKRVKFLFFGADMRECFTYTHYIEAMAGVPYRYGRTFTGTIIDKGIELQNQSAILYTSYANCVLNDIPIVYNEMLKRGQLSMKQIGDGSVCCFSEADAYETCMSLLNADSCCLTDGAFDESKKDATYYKHGRVVSV